MMNESDSRFDINELFQEAQYRWLKPPEVLFILQNHESQQFIEKVPQEPQSGSVFLFNKRVVKFFRKDGHTWRKKKSGRTVGEGHERLKVGKVEALNCYYAQGEQNPNLRRRIYWMLDSAYDHIVLVHYREISEGRHNAESTPLSWSSTLTPIVDTAQNHGSGSAVSVSYGAYQNPSPFDVTSDLYITNDEMNFFDRLDVSSSSLDSEAALQRIAEQLSLVDNNIGEVSPQGVLNENSIDSEVLHYERRSNQEELVALRHGLEYTEMNFFDGLNVSSSSLESEAALQRIEEQISLVDNNIGEVSPQGVLNENSLDSEVLHYERRSNQDELVVALQHGLEYRENGQRFCEIVGEYPVESLWNELMDQCPSSTLISSQEIFLNTVDESEKLQSSSGREKNPAELNKHHDECTSQWLDLSGNNSGERNNPPIFESNPNFHLSEAIPDFRMWFDQETQFETRIGVDSRLTVSQEQKFSIQEISPEWGYAADQSKVIITGYFRCNPSEWTWACMFGDIEVPVQIIQEGVLRCQAPSHTSGKVTLCITTGNREACSEVREFEYRINPESFVQSSPPQTDTKSTEELQLLIRFAEMLLTDILVNKDDSVKQRTKAALENPIVDINSWEHMKEELLLGTESESSVMDWLLQELLKEKLPQWLSLKCKAGETPGCSTLSKKEQEIIHMVAGLGFGWALEPILNSGIGINFRDANGWTALHHAAHFGREEMVIALLAAGASAGAVTDPTPQDPTGKTPGSIAASRGHKGLAGYLSELALTSHLSSLTLEESEISKGNSEVQAENTVENISKGLDGCTEDTLSLRRSLDAVRNAAQAAARIQAAFRQLSFKRRKQREALISVCDEYGITAADIPALSASSKLTFRTLSDRVLEKSAVAIQKKYRGWKGQKEFLALRQKIILIQAHVRGHQVRKKYKVILWAVGVLDKVLLRWRRKGVGLRGYRPEPQSADTSDDEDILKVFRKKKVDAAIEQAVSWVISMAHSPGARRQYRRLLESYRQAKAELCVETTSNSSQHDGESMEIINSNDVDFSQFP